MDVSELKGDLYELYHNRSSHWVQDILSFTTRSGILWQLGPVFTERETYGYDEMYKTFMKEACGTCIATQLEGPNPGVQGVAKIRMQYVNMVSQVSHLPQLFVSNLDICRLPDDPDDPSSTKPQNASYRVGLEFYNHDRLTKLGCTCIPKLLDSARLVQKEGDPLPGGFISLLVMERLPGRNLVNFADLPMSERNQIRLAFARSIREFYTFRFMHNDPARRNLMWDPDNKKCYIIDLEDAYQIDDAKEPTEFMPELHYREWEIAGPEINCHMYGLDPMVPHDDKFIKDPNDETLEEMATKAGNTLVFGK
ncbi:hypothetical protein FQN50_002794 [Emmonsiellopsis sp. PD_5]|nr:hypothetical protein FQN50_002794 [Emmonsiellopsis sp. PD_5]